jgi:hypothetical protein
MPVHSIIIINIAGNILYSKYFQQADTEKLAFEQALHVNTSAVWSKPLCFSKQTVCINGKYVVFQRVGELIVFVTGVEEVDEIICKILPPMSQKLTDAIVLLVELIAS